MNKVYLLFGITQKTDFDGRWKEKRITRRIAKDHYSIGKMWYMNLVGTLAPSLPALNYVEVWEHHIENIGSPVIMWKEQIEKSFRDI